MYRRRRDTSRRGCLVVVVHPGRPNHAAALSLVDDGLRPTYRTSHVIIVSGAKEAGVRAATGMLLRHIRADSDGVKLPSDLCVVHAPPPWFHTRGHQMGQWDFSFLSWAAAEEYIRHGCLRHKLCRVFVDGKYCEWCGNRNVSQAPIPCAVPSFRWILRVLVVRTGREGTSRRWQHTPSCWTR